MRVKEFDFDEVRRRAELARREADAMRDRIRVIHSESEEVLRVTRRLMHARRAALAWGRLADAPLTAKSGRC